MGAYFEAHIEQGPILEDEEKTIGVVLGALGRKWFDLSLRGVEAHAGPTPMHLRKDALVGAAAVVEAVNRAALSAISRMLAARSAACTPIPVRAT